ncbi:MAG: PIN domain-containing protein [Propionibacteriaceae bacterium]|jgi:predicted nucleic acid-binding protein|nr:PIN domain-containing protein [Propionibacteriaceae bacterium]
MSTLDTNCLVRLLIRDNPEMLKRVQDRLATAGSFWVPDVVLIETIYVLENVYRLARSEIVWALQAVLAMGNLEIDRNLWGELLDRYACHPKLSCTDIYLAAVVERHDRGPLLSFDKKMISQLQAAEP